MDQYIPNPVFGPSLTLISGSDMDRHPENVKSDFTTTLHEPIDLAGSWGVSLQSLTYSNDLVNYEGEPGEGEEEEEEEAETGAETGENGMVDDPFTEEDIGGEITPWYDNGVMQLETPTRLPWFLAEMRLVMTQKKTDDQWYMVHRPLMMTAVPREGMTAAYAEDIRDALDENTFLTRAPCVPDPGYHECTRMVVVDVNGVQYNKALHLEPMLHKWPNVTNFILEYLADYFKYATVNKVTFSLFHGKRFRMMGPKGTTFRVMRGRDQSAESFQTMLDHLGLGVAHESDLVIEGTVDPHNLAWVGPAEIVSKRIVPPGYNLFNYHGMEKGSVTITTTEWGGKSRRHRHTFDIGNLHKCKTSEECANKMFKVTETDFKWGLVLSITDDGRLSFNGVVDIVNGNTSMYKIRVETPANGCLSWMTGYRGREGRTSEGLQFNQTMKSFIEINVPVRLNYIFRGRPEWVLAEEKKMSEYVDVSVSPHNHELSFRMKKTDSVHGFMAWSHANAWIHGEGALVSIKGADEDMTARTSVTTGEDATLKMAAGFPENEQAFMKMVRVRDVQDIRVVRSIERATMVVRGFTCQKVVRESVYGDENQYFADQDASAVAYVKGVEGVCHLKGPAAYKNTTVLKKEIMRCLQQGLDGRDERWRRVDNIGLKAEDVVSVEWIEAERKFEFSCGEKFDYVELSLSPRLSALCGWAGDREVLLRLTNQRMLYVCANRNHGHGFEEGSDGRLPVPLERRRRREGGFWVADPTFGGRYPVQTHLSGAFPVSLSMGVNNIYIHTDLIGDTQYVGSDRTDLLGVVPINWESKGNDAHRPIHENYIYVPTKRLTRVRMRLLDYQGRRIKFMSNNGATVIVTVDLKRMV